MNWFDRAAELGSVVRDLVYPPHCLACRGGLPESGALHLCDRCRDDLGVFAGPFCDHCGAPVPLVMPGARGCGHCRKQRLRFDTTIALGPYAGPLRDLVLATKRPHGELLTLGLGQLLMHHRGEEIRQAQIDVVCGVPMHWRRRLSRLACGPALLAEVVAKAVGCPYAATLVRRRRSTVPQAQLSRTERQRNVRGAFVLGRGHRLNRAHVLLIDDILTTGATCSEISRVLKRGGASRVTVAVLARSFAGSDRAPALTAESGLPVSGESQE